MLSVRWARCPIISRFHRSEASAAVTISVEVPVRKKNKEAVGIVPMALLTREDAEIQQILFEAEARGVDAAVQNSGES